jgi:hypothetical protein
MQLRAAWSRLPALAALAAVALLALAPDPDMLPPVPGPAILDITFSPEHLRAGRSFEVTVRTTPDVMSMQAWVMKYRLPVPKTADGVFSGSARVPWWAGIYHGTFHVMFVGAAATGEQAQMEAAVRI